jgi:hypothetical protein
LAVSGGLVISVGTTAFTELYDRRWVDRSPVGFVPNTTPEGTKRECQWNDRNRARHRR